MQIWNIARETVQYKYSKLFLLHVSKTQLDFDQYPSLSMTSSSSKFRFALLISLEYPSHQRTYHNVDIVVWFAIFELWNRRFSSPVMEEKSWTMVKNRKDTICSILHKICSNPKYLLSKLYIVSHHSVYHASPKSPRGLVSLYPRWYQQKQ